MAQLSGGRFLAQLNRNSPMLGALFQRLIDAHNHVASQAGVDPVTQASPPPPVNAVTPTVIGEQLHLRITDNAPTNRARHYFSEVFTDPNYSNMVHVEHHGVSRDAAIPLPTMNDSGDHNQYYVQSYSGTAGSPPSAPVRVGPITMAGTTQGTLPTSAGSGTGNANGTQPGQGFGVAPIRKATGVIRKV